MGDDNEPHLGMGVMIRMLFGNEETFKAYRACVGKKITAVKMEDDKLRLSFANGTTLVVFDNGQSCCEHRYMMTDENNLDYYVGSNFLQLEIRPAPDITGEYDVHEVQFLDVKTSKGVFQMVTHNEHNGYYGGFSIECQLVEGGPVVPEEADEVLPSVPDEEEI